MKYIYFAQANFGGPIKIGCSYNEINRSIEISKDLPYEMVLLGSCKGDLFRERFIQCWFHNVHLRGEWFGHHPEIWRWAFEAKSTGNIGIVPPSLPTDKAYAVSVEFVLRLLEKRGISPKEIADVARIQVNSVNALLTKPYMQSTLTLGAIFSLAIKREWRFPGWNRIKFIGIIPNNSERKASNRWKLNDPQQRIVGERRGAAE